MGADQVKETRVEKKEWIRRINSACKKAGTFLPQYKNVIETLAQIMEERDRAHDQYVATGQNPVIMHTNKGGATNVVKNPILVMESELNAAALAYWRDLGLTPAGFKRLGDTVQAAEKGQSLETILSSLGG